MSTEQELPIFFAVDDEYIPFLAVTLQSLVEHSSSKNNYVIKVLYTHINDEVHRFAADFSEFAGNFLVEGARAAQTHKVREAQIGVVLDTQRAANRRDERSNAV